jgi:hypothetical protein
MPIGAMAQQTTGDILGTVTDGTGAVVAGAKVTVENLGTREHRMAVTSNGGDYVVNLLNPGTYSVTVTASGFRTFAVSSVALAAGDRTRVNAQMSVGSTSQTVTVAGQASALQTDSSVLSSTIGGQATQDLPLNGRNFIQLVQLQPGVNEGPPTSLTNGSELDDRRQSAALSVNGQSDVLNNEMIDGADNNERLIGTVAVRPAIDAIAEINVQTNTYTAEVGRTGGGIINVITKSGTNHFHGDVFEFFRNDVFDANTYNFGAVLPKSELRQNQFGGSLGGPIFKGKTFFFGAYEGYREVQGVAPQENIVPTLYEEQNPGDFSDVGEGVLAPGSIDPAGLDYFKMYPAPNSGSDLYVHGYNNTQNSTDYDARIDHTFNPSNLMYGRFIYNSVYTNSPGAFPDVTVAGITLNPSPISSGLGYAQDTDYDGLLNYIHIFNSSLVLELKAAYTRSDNTSYPETEGQNPNAAFGQPNMNTPISDATGLAFITVVEGAGLGSELFQPLKDEDNTFQYLGSVTYTHGAHNVKMGATVIRRQLTSFQSSYPEGLWVFLGYPELLQGQFITNSGRSLALDAPHLRLWEPAFYIQDDWRARKNLTINIGIRYGIYTPYTEIQDRISTWDPTSESLLIAGQNGVSNSAGIQTDYHGLAPRIGFAWDAGHQFVVHGGFGIGYFPMNTTSNANLKNPPFVATVDACNSPGWGSTDCPTGYTSFADGFPLPTAASIDNPGASIPDAVSPHFRTSYMEQFNLTLQKEFAQNVLTVSYVGLLGRQLGQLLPDLNAPPPNDCAASTNPNCYQSLRPYYAKYPNLGLIGYFQTGGKSSYNALQVSVERRLSHGFAMNANYSWSHDLDNSTGLSEENAGGYGMVPSEVSKTDYGNSPLDLRQRLAATGSYHLPFGEHATGFRGIATSGWQANVIAVWNTGTPFTVVNATNVSDTVPSVDDRPNQTGKASLSNPGLSEFFNINAFQPQAAGTLGSERRDQLFGPHWRHLDLSLFKVFPIHNSVNLEFRAESFNLTNTANFAVPNDTVPTGFVPGDPSTNTNLFGEVTSMNYNYIPRELQFALKLSF